MDAANPREQSQVSRRQDGELDRRYGKIGISAVAAAVRCKGEEPRKSAPRTEPFERD